jgi:Asp-tRNA(Asn)/Glu-tRNA(Gln) amidotransferase A subunit family amidase
VLVLPCGCDEDGLPFGLQIVGRRGGDAGLLRLGLALEEAFAGSAATRRPLPPLHALAAAGS